MTDKQWYELNQQNRQVIIDDLLAQGYKRQERDDIYRECFVKEDVVLVVVRQFGSANWWAREL